MCRTQSSRLTLLFRSRRRSRGPRGRPHTGHHGAGRASCRRCGPGCCAASAAAAGMLGPCGAAAGGQLGGMRSLALPEDARRRRGRADPSVRDCSPSACLCLMDITAASLQLFVSRATWLLHCELCASRALSHAWSVLDVLLRTECWLLARTQLAFQVGHCYHRVSSARNHG